MSNDGPVRKAAGGGEEGVKRQRVQGWVAQGKMAIYTAGNRLSVKALLTCVRGCLIDLHGPGLGLLDTFWDMERCEVRGHEVLVLDLEVARLLTLHVHRLSST